MGHKAIVVFDIDHLDTLSNDTEAFVQALKHQILAHRRTGGSVHHGGATVADVVWSGHADCSPVLKFIDFRADEVNIDKRD